MWMTSAATLHIVWLEWYLGAKMYYLSFKVSSFKYDDGTYNLCYYLFPTVDEHDLLSV